MSSPIWTPCAASSEIGPLSLSAVRLVESQTQSATRKLVDTADEHDLLEAMLEASKPSVPAQATALSYLLFTPFRYPPLRYGSRFGRVHERGIWYGSRHLTTALAEVAYYRLRFLSASDAFDESSHVRVALTAFSAAINTARGVDLTAPRFSDMQAHLRSKHSYSATQPLGSAMREADVHAFVFASARDPEGGDNVGVFEPTAFGNTAPYDEQHFECHATLGRVEFTPRTLRRDRLRHIYTRSQFEVDGRLPAP